jgi:hypothetical protein
VFKDVPCLVRPGVSWRQNHHVPPLVPRAAASPVAIGGSTVVAAGVTGGRMHLLRAPQAQRLWDLHDGQRKCPLDGWNVRPHSVQTRLVITSSYRNQVHVPSLKWRVTELIIVMSWLSALVLRGRARGWAIGAGRRERPSAPRPRPRESCPKPGSEPRRDANHADKPGLVGGTRS